MQRPKRLESEKAETGVKVRHASHEAAREGRISAIFARAAGRRSFLKMCVAGSAAVLSAPALGGCGSGSSVSTSFSGDGGDLGQGDTAILNTFYGYKQLTVAFLSRVTAGGASLSADELTILTQIHRHEVAHLNFLRAFLGVNAIPDLSGFDFTSIPQTDRERILSTVREFEDVGVAGYDGSLRYLTQADHVRHLAKLLSVDARHSAVVRDILDPGKATFAGSSIVGSRNGLERRTNPYFVFSVVRSYGPVPVLNTGDLP